MRAFIAATLFTAAIAAPHYGSGYGEQPNYGSGYNTGEETTPAMSYPAVTPTPAVPSSYAVSTPEASSSVPAVSSSATKPSETPYVPGYGTPEVSCICK